MTQTEIVDLLETYKSAVAAKDLASLLAIYADDVVAFDTWDAWVLEGAEAWRRMNEQWLGSTGEDRDVIAYDDVRTLASGDLGHASAIVTYSATTPDGRVLRSMQTRLTWLARKTGEGWKIVHQHTSVPIESSSLSAVLQR